MSIKRIIAIAVIYFAAAGGWFILGTVTSFRSTELRGKLGYEVQNLWGTPLVQQAPSWSVQIPGTDQVRWIMPEANNINVKLATDYRKKGLVWYPTYTCHYEAVYKVANNESVAQKVHFRFDFPAKGATYSDFFISAGDAPITEIVDTREGVHEIVELAPGQSKEFKIVYGTRGIGEWRYRLSENTGRVKNLNLVVNTLFENHDYPDGTLSPMSSEHTSDGMKLTWTTPDLITNQDMGVVIPEKLNPGPLTSRITFFAPVCLLFFFVLVAAVNIIYKVSIHPMHYLFVAAGFFAFHLLLSYMTGVVHIHIAFIISALTSVGLVTMYMSAALRGKFPWKIAVAGQAFFLILFSYSFFLKGITGLTVAIGSVLTLAILMKTTAKVDWNEVFKKSPKKSKVRVPDLPVVEQN